MIKFKNDLGEFEFTKVEDLKAFLQKEELTDHDMMNFGYLISNVTGHSELAAFCQRHGLGALRQLRDRGMNSLCKELK